MTGVRLVAIPLNLNLTTLALGGATIGANALAVTGTVLFNSNVTFADGTIFGPSQPDFANNQLSRVALVRFNNGNDAQLGSSGANSIRLGNADVDTAPAAQTLRTQGALGGGTSNVSGANWTFIASPGKGTGTGGSFIFQTAPAGITGTIVGTPTTALTIDSTQLATFAAGINSVGSHTFTIATSGIVLKRGANGLCGTFVANGITPVTVSNSNVAITDAIIISLNTVGGTVGVQPHVASITGASQFTVVCTATDTSTYNYAIIKNAA